MFINNVREEEKEMARKVCMLYIKLFGNYMAISAHIQMEKEDELSQDELLIMDYSDEEEEEEEFSQGELSIIYEAASAAS